MNRRQRLLRCGHRAVDERAISRFRELLLKDWANWGRDFPWRRARASRYHQVVSEILLQRTRANVVAAFWPEFIRRFPSWKAIASRPVRELHRALSPIGLANQRAPRLHSLAMLLGRTNGRFPRERVQVEGLPAVGQYVANAVSLFCHGKPAPLLDATMARVLERFFGERKLADIRYDPYLQSLAAHVVDDFRSRALNWAILDHGALVCRTKNPLCGQCSLASSCRYAQSRKRETTIDVRPVIIIETRNRGGGMDRAAKRGQ